MLNWLSMSSAAKRFGYSNASSLRRRIRQLRETGKVEDLGSPPEGYDGRKGPIKVFWVNPVTMLISPDAPKDLLLPKVGRR